MSNDTPSSVRPDSVAAEPPAQATTARTTSTANLPSTSWTDTHARRLAVALWLRMVRVEQKGHRFLTEALHRHTLSIAQFDVIAHIGAAEGMTQQDLADSLFVTKGNVCQLLDRLSQRGLLMRRQEGRSNRLYLTEAGRAVFEEVVPAQEAEIARLFSSLTPDERTTLLSLLRKLDHSMGSVERGDCK